MFEQPEPYWRLFWREFRAGAFHWGRNQLLWALAGVVLVLVQIKFGLFPASQAHARILTVLYTAGGLLVVYLIVHAIQTLAAVDRQRVSEIKRVKGSLDSERKARQTAEARPNLQISVESVLYKQADDDVMIFAAIHTVNTSPVPTTIRRYYMRTEGRERYIVADDNNEARQFEAHEFRQGIGIRNVLSFRALHTKAESLANDAFTLVITDAFGQQTMDTWTDAS